MANISDSIYFSSPKSIQNLLISMMGLNLYYKRYTGRVARQIIDDLEKSKRWSKAEISEHQSERLHEMVKYCYSNIDFYHRTFVEYGIKPADITSVVDIKKLPILKKETVRKNLEFIKNKRTKPYITQNTSGSTGTPLSLWLDEYTYKLAMHLLVEHEKNSGVQFGEKRATFAGRMLQPIDNFTPPFSRMNHAENQRLFSSYHLNENTFWQYHKELSDFSPKELIGYPSSIYLLAHLYSKHSVNPSFSPTAIITNSETLLDWQREVIERVFKTKVRDYYGSAEYVTYSGQCEFGNYHLNSLIGFTEVTNENGDQVYGQEGSVTCTTLTNLAMPLLRYEIGDKAIIHKDNCQCGNHSEYFSSIVGRVDDVIETDTGIKVGRIDHIFKGNAGIQEAQVIQKSLNLCQIKIVKSSNNRQIDEESIINNLMGRTSKNMHVEIQYVDEIPKGKNGKFKGVINELGKS